MARGKIVVETSQLDTAATKVDELANDYEAEYKKLFATVTALEEAWGGEDNVAFTQQIEGFKDDFQRMTRLMKDYADYLRKTAKTYRDTQDTVANKAKTLSQGS